MAIEITVEKKIIREEPIIILKRVKALTEEELPFEYLVGIPCFYKEIDCGTPAIRIVGKDFYRLMHVGAEIPRKIWENRYLPTIQAAGERLKKINDQIRKLKQEWHGEETYII